MKYAIFFFAIIILEEKVLGQTSNISGVINSYIDVVSSGPCANQITVSNSAGFAVGDVVLIIQMQGAIIDQTNTASFGNITSYNNSGRFERATISNISGNNIYFTFNLVNSYDLPLGKVQMIRIPQYADVIVNGVLTCQSWNGTTGGVLIFDATGTVTLNDNINVAGMGFLGGTNTQVCPNSCNFSTNDNAYFYANGNYRGAPKGNGIASMIVGKELGRGAQANGGGGGNDHNNGGGGGGNLGAGGLGGNNAEPGAFNCKGNGNFGRPGFGLALGSGRLFLGGGGGAGQGNNGSTGGCPNNGNSGSGGNGGGMVIISCNTLNGNNRQIIASGANGGFANGDGGGGGGAGGIIALNITGSISPSTLTLIAAGGNGGSTSGFGGNRCYGPGGGGGGGGILANIVLPGTVITNTNGGTPGIVTSSSNACAGTSTTATSGGAGSITSSFVIPVGTIVPTPGCIPLPVEYLSFNGKYEDYDNVLQWTTATEINNRGFEVEHSTDCIQFKSKGFVSGVGNSNIMQSYVFIDQQPAPGIHYYRLNQIDFDGKNEYSSVISVYVPEQSDLFFYPNPANDYIYIDGQALDDKEVLILNSLGITVKSLKIVSGQIDIADLPAGSYQLVLRHKYQVFRKSIIIY